MNKFVMATAVSTAALFAATGAMAQASKPTLTVGGFVDSKFSVNKQDDAFTAANGARVNFDQRQDGEVHFNGAVTLDNGIKIRSRVELEAFTPNDNVNDVFNFTNGANSQGDTIDEAWLDIAGSFGALRLGSTDPASMRMTTGHQATFFMNVGENTRFNSRSLIRAPATVATSTVSQLDLTSDAENVSYVTPRFLGFQLGGNYASTSFEDSSQNTLKSQGALSDIYGVAINWAGKFDAVGISVAAGYTAGNTTNSNANNPEQWSLGGRVTFGGFAVGLSTQQNDCSAVGTAFGNGCAAGVTYEESIYEAGIRYIAGPNQFSVVGAWAEVDSNQAAQNGDESKVYSIAYARTLGPGVEWQTTLHIADYNDGLAGAPAGNSNDGYGVTTGILLNF